MALKKILILVPGPNARGGITNYYYSIKEDLPENVIYITRGSRNWPNKGSKLSEIGRIFKDNYNFIRTLIKEDVSVVQIALPFTKTAIIRDGLFILIGKLFSKKVVVFFRGWVDEYVYNLSGFRLFLVKKVLFSSNAIIELSRDNKKHLMNLGYKKKIYLETTLVDKKLVENFDFSDSLARRITSSKKKILFLSRIEKEKGIYTLLEVFKNIQKQYPEFELIFAGDGKEYLNLEKKIKNENMNNVHLKGFVTGQQKMQLFTEATIFVFLSEREGMPNAVLEAMAFGLPVITTNVGGIPLVFENNKNGYLLDTPDVKTISENIVDIIVNIEKYKKISSTNYSEAKEKFWSNVVAKRMMRIFDEVIAAN